MKKVLFFLVICAQTLYPQDERFSFLHITDLHLASGKEGNTYKHANERLENLINEINGEEEFKLPEFVLITGDLANVVPFSSELAREHLEYAKEKLDHLKCKYYPGIGNHENNWKQGKDPEEEIFQKVLGFPTNYIFEHDNIVFMMVNSTSGRDNYFQAVEKRRNFWVDSVLNAYMTKNVIVCMHISPIPQRENSPTWTHIWDGNVLENILQKHSYHIPFVLSGHIHLNSRNTVNELNFITTSALASYPNEYKHCTVYKDSIVVRTYCAHPNDESESPLWKDQIDAAHLNPDVYVKGTEYERNFTVKINNFLTSKRENKANNDQVSLKCLPSIFNQNAKILYTLKNEDKVEVTIHDLHGEVVKNIFNGWQKKGNYSFSVTMDGMASGMYFVRFRSNTATAATKIIYYK